METNKKIANNIKALRVFLDVSMDTWARNIGVSKSYVSLVESGQREPSVKYIAKISAYYGCPIERVVYGPSKLIIETILREMDV